MREFTPNPLPAVDGRCPLRPLRSAEGCCSQAWLWFGFPAAVAEGGSLDRSIALTMFWRKQKRFTDGAIAYIKASNPEAGGPVVMLPPAATPVVRRYSDDLCVCYMVDCGKHYEYVQQCHLKLDGIDQDELHRIGLRNLRALVTQRQARVQPYQSVFAFLMRGDFEASVILLDDLWDGDFRQFVTGEYAAAIPARDVLAFCDSSSADGIAELQRIIERVQPTGDHLLTRTIYVRRDNRWQARVV